MKKTPTPLVTYATQNVANLQHVFVKSAPLNFVVVLGFHVGFLLKIFLNFFGVNLDGRFLNLGVSLDGRLFDFP